MEDASSSSSVGSGSEIEHKQATREEASNIYEKQRQSRIKENRARLESLGITCLSSSLFSSSSAGKEQRRGKPSTPRARATRKRGDESDDEYRPSDDEASGDHKGAGGSGPSHRDEEEEDVGYMPPPSSYSRIASKVKHGKKKLSTNEAKSKSLYMKEKMERLQDIDDETALQQAIALSLGNAAEDLAASADQLAQSSDRIADANIKKKKEETRSQETPSKKKRKTNISRVRLTEDEVVAYFFAFDEVGKGHIALRDLRRLAVAHDYCWTDTEIADMIHCFDSKGNGKLGLEDFRTILTRCKMLLEPAED